MLFHCEIALFFLRKNASIAISLAVSVLPFY